MHCFSKCYAHPSIIYAKKFLTPPPVSPYRFFNGLHHAYVQIDFSAPFTKFK